MGYTTSSIKGGRGCGGCNPSDTRGCERFPNRVAPNNIGMPDLIQLESCTSMWPSSGMSQRWHNASFQQEDEIAYYSLSRESGIRKKCRKRHATLRLGRLAHGTAQIGQGWITGLRNPSHVLIKVGDSGNPELLTHLWCPQMSPQSTRIVACTRTCGRAIPQLLCGSTT